MKTFLVIFLISHLVNICSAFTIKLGINKNWSISDKIIREKNISKEFSLELFDLESTLLNRVSNLQLDAAIIPITSFKYVFDRQSHLSKFVINAVVGEELVGNITLKKCNKKYKEIKVTKLITDEFSPEFKWFVRKNKLSSPPKKNNYYEILNFMESEKLDCESGVIGSKRFLEKLKNGEKYKIEKIGSLPMILLVEEHFLKNRYKEIQSIKKLLLRDSVQADHFRNNFEILSKDVFEYNFSGTNFRLERLNEIVKPI